MSAETRFRVALSVEGQIRDREVVEAVLYLESAAFVDGETLHVDGGGGKAMPKRA